LARIDGFRTLSAVTKDTNEPALTSQVVSLHRVYLEYIQNARSLHPLQDSGSVGAASSAPYHQTTHHISTRNDRAYSTSSTGSVGYSGGASSYGFNSSYNTGGPGTVRSSSNNSSRNFLNTQQLQQQQQHQSATPYAPALSMANLLSGSHSAVHNGHSASNQNHELDSQVEDGSIAAMGFNIAFNLVNELLK
jgi:hypothetical protein